MKLIHIFKSLVLFSALGNRLNAQPPKAPSQPVTETFFGKEVTDRFRNLENLSDSTVMNWYKAQATYTDDQLNKLPLRGAIYNELKNLDDKIKFQIPIRPGLFPNYRGDKIFYVKIFAVEQVGKLYYRQSDGNDVLIFDPNKNNTSPLPNSISGFTVNDEGSKAGVIVVAAGNEVGRLFILDTRTKEVIDSIERVWFLPDWQSNDVIIYTQAPFSDVHNKGFLSNWIAKKHMVGNDASIDSVLVSHSNNPDMVPDSALFPEVSLPHKNARYVICDVEATRQFNNAYLSSLDQSGSSSLNWYPFIKMEDQIRRYVLQGDKAFGLSVKDNKKGKILLTSAANPDWKNAKVIAEGEKGSISGLNPFVITKNYLYYVESYGVERKLYRVNLDGSQKQEIKLPVTGMIVPFSESSIESNVKIFVISYIQPTIIYDFDEAKKTIIKPGLWLTPKVGGLDNVEVEETYVPSYDGTKVPLTIIKPKGIRKDGSHKVIVYGYGNYGMVEPPLFDPTLSVMGGHDVIKAIAHVRGGGEFGEPWRLGGYKSTKPNTWKDAIACAEYMIKEGYGQPSKMGIMGISAGGILAGRAMTERPDLFAVALPEVGVLNTLRFEFTPNGPNHISEFGTITNEDDFRNLYEMDSYVHIKDGVKYPATLVTGGLNDPRVILWQPGKFAARLQQASASGKPVWFRIDMHGGHGNMASTKDQRLKLTADELAFFLSQTDGEQKSKRRKAF
jgi:prolyl oligopeptidase